MEPGVNPGLSTVPIRLNGRRQGQHHRPCPFVQIGGFYRQFPAT